MPLLCISLLNTHTVLSICLCWRVCSLAGVQNIAGPQVSCFSTPVRWPDYNAQGGREGEKRSGLISSLTLLEEDRGM